MLTPEEQEALESRRGVVAIKIRDRPVQNLGMLKPKQVVAAVRRDIADFNMGTFIAAWKRLGVRPARFASDPRATDTKYCVYDEAHQDYLYTDAYVKRLIREFRNQEAAS